ncbi:hypothetical protein [Jiulongibacter sediminis]|jgi:hypothetical protein|uniref:hypothetical protein n=1 Tax=Jiulongibacter sediminis TaxID=1605367 RepID=UPI0006DCFF22|nr:hypothetical protein [Jiulongibacter sediminis]
MSEELKDGLKHHCENHERCMEMIQAVLDGSATPEEMQHYKTEMNRCLPCIEGEELQKSIKHALNAKIEKKCCPEQTISQIKSKLSVASLLLLLLVAEIKLIDIYF